MSAQRTERLLNLVICLLATRRWLSKEQIRSAVPQYTQAKTTEAFDRMFERDKEDLRELGIPVHTGTDERWFDDEVGYRIDRDAYQLPAVHLNAAELTVVALAGRVWRQAGLAGPAAQALAKLTSDGVELDHDAWAGVEPGVRTAEPSFAPLYAAVRDRRTVAFDYRRSDGERSARRVQPWAMASRSGHWYLVAHDCDRQATRVFRLSRITGDVRALGAAGAYEVPPDLDVRALLAPQPATVATEPAVLALRPGRATALRRRGAALPSSAGQPRSAEHPDLIRLEITDLDQLADEITGFGDDVIVLQPPQLRTEVVRRLQDALSAQERVG